MTDLPVGKVTALPDPEALALALEGLAFDAQCSADSYGKACLSYGHGVCIGQAKAYRDAARMVREAALSKPA